MELKISTIIVVTVLWVISIQIVVAPPTPADNDISQEEIQELLKHQENFQKLVEIFNTNVKNGVTEAKKILESYAKNELSPQLNRLLELAIDAPKNMYNRVAPIVKEMDEQYQRNSKMYRTIFTPLWSFATNVGYIAARALGFSAWTLGQLIHSFNEAAKEGMITYNDGEPLTGKAKNVYEQVNLVGDIAKAGGKVLTTRANLGLGTTKAQNKPSRTTTSNSRHEEDAE